MKKHNRVRHKIKDGLGVVYSIDKHGVLVNWSDQVGIRFRLARRDDLEVIDAPKV